MAIEDRLTGFLKDARDWERRAINIPAVFLDGIVDYAQKATNDSDVLSLFESLDGYIEFKDRHHVQKALEVNGPEKKAENQITD